MRKALIVATSLATLTAMAHVEREKIVYGEDNRKEVYEVSEDLQKLAASTAAMVEVKKMVKLGSSYMLAPNRLGDDWNLCAEEKFRDQPSPAMCSGFLIGPDLLVTAGHCITVEEDCASNAWVFDFKVKESTGKADVVVPAKNVYTCKKIIRSILQSPASAADKLGRDDFSLVQLDRVVEGRAPLKVRTEGKIEIGDDLVVIGHPSGLPSKVADGGLVRANEHEQFFKTNLDTFGGNSGSGVFNLKDGTIEGILVRGDKDYIFDDVEGCFKVNQVSNDRGEEAVTRITNIVELKYREKMFEAAKTGNIAQVTKILGLGYNVNFYNNNRSTALHVAAYYGKTAVVKLLIAKGADVNATNLLGGTPLHAAKMGNREQTARLLVSLGANKDAKDFKGKVASQY